MQGKKVKSSLSSIDDGFLDEFAHASTQVLAPVRPLFPNEGAVSEASREPWPRSIWIHVLEIRQAKGNGAGSPATDASKALHILVVVSHGTDLKIQIQCGQELFVGPTSSSRHLTSSLPTLLSAQGAHLTVVNI